MYNQEDQANEKMSDASSGTRGARTRAVDFFETLKGLNAKRGKSRQMGSSVDLRRCGELAAPGLDEVDAFAPELHTKRF